jgi:hypothetical protein
LTRYAGRSARAAGRNTTPKSGRAARRGAPIGGVHPAR